MKSNNEFSDSVSAFSVFDQLDLAPKSPKPSPTSKDAAGKPKLKYASRYGKFILDENGNPELQNIMDQILLGKYLLGQEKWYFTKDGDTLVVLKYLVPVEEPAATLTPEQADKYIAGRRRQRKALESKKDHEGEKP